MLFDSLAALTGAAHMSIIGFDDYLVPNVVSAESRGGVSLARDAGHLYQRSLLYMHDPTRLTIIQRPIDAEGPILGRLHASEIVNRAYRGRIYDHYGLVERLSLLDQMDGNWYVLNLYRAGADGPFADDDIATLTSLAPVLSSLVGKQLAITSTAPPLAARSSSAFEVMVRGAAPTLTPRQIQVCARALMGMTNTAIALDLGIQPSTVSTLRKRAYAVLGISSLNDLFARCLVRPCWH
jgi:DNA-binding CsgD family transcriptional regulator